MTKLLLYLVVQSKFNELQKNVYIYIYIYKPLEASAKPYNISVPLDVKVTKDTRLILNIKYTSEN